jgi:hypothetical protein
MGNYDDGRIKTFRDFYSPLKANGDGKEREAGIAGKYTYYRPGDPVLGWKKEE